MKGALHVLKYTLEKIRSGAVSRLVNTGDQRPRLTVSSMAVERVKEKRASDGVLLLFLHLFLL